MTKLKALTLTMMLAVLSLCLPTGAFGQAQYRVLYSFGAEGFLDTGGSIDGDFPNQGLIFDHSGNIYGTTEEGGPVPCENGYGCGTVFELSPQPGGWGHSVLFNFCTTTGNPETCPEGAYPQAGLLLDKAGNLYGTTDQGGNGFGVVFELSPPLTPGTAWTETVLYAPVCCSGGGLYPDSQLTMDGSGNLYGANGAGGIIGGGNIFELSPPDTQGGEWTVTVLYTFCQLQDCTDGFEPAGGVVFDRAGNLYGATRGGGASSNGTVFELSQGDGGQWMESVLYSFSASGQGGAFPSGNLTLDSEGNIYGPAFSGGLISSKYCDDWTKHCGGIFRLLKNANWEERFFPFDGLDGGVPLASVYLDEQKRVSYSVTELGGTQAQGTVFEISESGETVIYNFCSQPSCADGSQPAGGGGLAEMGGNLYGTAQAGGAYGYGPGVVFEIAP
jgi:uncharacterized repeat protein (TIGR03803 family)